MNPQELRIGNLVDTINRSERIHLPNGFPKVVGQIGLFEVELYFMDKPIAQQLSKQHVVSLRDIAGIPLTEEWMRIFGRQQDRNDVFEALPGIYWYISQKLKTCNSKSDYIIQPPDYVHEYQNLHRWLTGEELTIDHGK